MALAALAPSTQQAHMLSGPALPFMQAGIQDATGFIMFPLVVHSLDLVVSAVGIMSVGSVGRQREDPYAVMKVRPQKPRQWA